MIKICHLNHSVSMEAPSRFELENKAFAELCLTTWLWRHIFYYMINFKLYDKRRLSVFCLLERKTRFELATFTLAR